MKEKMMTISRPQLPDIIFATGILSLIVVGAGVCGFPVFRDYKEKSRTSAVAINVATLQLAAETFAASHQGQYADNAVDLLPYLPENEAPVNPYTADRLLFQGVVGDLTYQSIDGGQDYIIKAYTRGRGPEPLLLRTVTGNGSRSDY